MSEKRIILAPSVYLELYNSENNRLAGTVTSVGHIMTKICSQ